MKHIDRRAPLAAAMLVAVLGGTFGVAPAWATGLATCDSGPEEGWQSQEVLQERLEGEGWEIRRIKVDGGCYEVYAKNAEGERVEAYFHPVTLEPVPVEDDHGD